MMVIFIGNVQHELLQVRFYTAVPAGAEVIISNRRRVFHQPRFAPTHTQNKLMLST